MTHSESHIDTKHTKAAGFALPAVLIVVVAMLILSIGLLLITGIERQTARSMVDYERANLAVRAAFEEMQGVLLSETTNDDFVVFGANREEPLRADRMDTPYLFIARAEDGEIRYEPLFSHLEKPPTSEQFTAPDVESITDDAPGGHVEFSALPYQDNVRVPWVYLADERGRNVARYAWFVEDMQGRLDASKAGNLDGDDETHVRAVYPFPAPGIPVGENAADMPTISAAALYALDPEASDDNQGELTQTLIENRDLMISPGSLLAAAEAEVPLERDQYSGRLGDSKLRAVEESLAANNRSYLERPLIPFTNGIDSSAVGTPKINLNEVLQSAPSNSVNEMAQHIRDALPRFDDRKGGFPEDYIKTLAANALGYASSPDTPPIVLLGDYRGIGAYPHVSEFLMRFYFRSKEQSGGQETFNIDVTTYVELWNMSNQVLSGDFEISYETKYEFPIGAVPDYSLEDLDDAEHDLTIDDEEEYNWFPSRNITLQPNEYRLINCGTVKYSFEYSGVSSVASPDSFVMRGETFGASEAGYRMRWNGVMVDQTGGGLHRYNADMSVGKQAVRTTIPGHSYQTGIGQWTNNMGDPRMAWYLTQPQDQSAYPGNYSPNRRNVRRATIYNGDGTRKPKVWGRVLPSEWPDGGHNSPFSIGTLTSTTDTQIEPDDESWGGSNIPPLIDGDSPQRLSLAGRFYSATELGHVYDPLMWAPTYQNGSDTDSIRSGFMPTSQERWPDVRQNSPASSDHGGGNTLRIGRPEHSAFDLPGDRSRHAVRLLDLFHAGIPQSESQSEREGNLVRIDGHVNLNTAGRDVLRTLAAGPIAQDLRISEMRNLNHETNRMRPFAAGISAIPFAPYGTPLKLKAPEVELLADRVADAIISARPFASPADAVFARTSDGEYVFGNREQFKDNIRAGATIEWSDAAAEELFARVYNSSTTRSRNFRVYVIGQSLAPTTVSGASAEVLAESRKVFTLFADPGERSEDGSIIPNNSNVQILHEIDF